MKRERSSQPWNTFTDARHQKPPHERTRLVAHVNITSALDYGLSTIASKSTSLQGDGSSEDAFRPHLTAAAQTYNDADETNSSPKIEPSEVTGACKARRKNKRRGAKKRAASSSAADAEGTVCVEEGPTCVLAHGEESATLGTANTNCHNNSAPQSTNTSALSNFKAETQKKGKGEISEANKQHLSKALSKTPLCAAVVPGRKGWYCEYCDVFTEEPFTHHAYSLPHLRNVDAFQTSVLEPMIKASLGLVAAATRNNEATSTISDPAACPDKSITCVCTLCGFPKTSTNIDTSDGHNARLNPITCVCGGRNDSEMIPVGSSSPPPPAATGAAIPDTISKLTLNGFPLPPSPAPAGAVDDASIIRPLAPLPYPSVVSREDVRVWAGITSAIKDSHTRRASLHPHSPFSM